jgi:NAD(P)-dependent dehydrogenase (short-subunit alcohol dehydrogenase family)
VFEAGELRRRDRVIGDNGAISRRGPHGRSGDAGAVGSQRTRLGSCRAAHLVHCRAMNAEAVYPSLEGRRVLVTGGGSGMGAEIVRGFARNGAQVAVLDIDREAGGALAEELGPRVRFVECGLKDVDALRAAAVDVGPVTALINNAADDQRDELEGITPEQWDAAHAVNLRHQFFMAQAVIPGMRAGGGGSIVNLSSVAWLTAHPGTAPAGGAALTHGFATAFYVLAAVAAGGAVIAAMLVESRPATQTATATQAEAALEGA